jgi:hypothetical protein
MRRKLIVSMVAGVYALSLVLALNLVGCAGPGTSGPGAAPTGDPSASDPSASDPSAGDASADTKEAQVYVRVLARYLGPPGDTSFPEGTFKTVYVLDQAFPDAGDPHGTTDKGSPIPAGIQRVLVVALAKDGFDLKFIADKKTVLEDPEGCAQVKDGGILVTLGTIKGDDTSVQVGVSGFVACLGATWLTYVVRNEAGTGWKVTGTTGPMAIA